MLVVPPAPSSASPARDAAPHPVPGRARRTRAISGTRSMRRARTSRSGCRGCRSTPIPTRAAATRRRARRTGTTRARAASRSATASARRSPRRRRARGVRAPAPERRARLLAPERRVAARVHDRGRARRRSTGRFGTLNAHRIRVAAATDNHASLGVIRRLGFRFEGIAREAERCQGRWLDHALFALLATDGR